METKLDSLNIDEGLIILFDDVNSQVGYLMGLAEHVSGESINFMTHVAKGLTYVCITKKQAMKLNLHLFEKEDNSNSKSFTESVDYMTNSTGISAFERSDTIKAFTRLEAKPDDFKRPGHLFPLVSKDTNMLERIGIAEVAVFLAKHNHKTPVAYVSEILNDNGEIATKNEVIRLSQYYHLPILTFSEVAKFQYERTKWLTILDYKCISNLENILVYHVKNHFSNQLLKMYVRLGASENINTIFYRECQFELLNGDQCNCIRHFKDYYSLLKNKEIDVIVFEHEHDHHGYPDYEMMDGIITAQINELIDEINQKHKVDKKVVLSNY
ncbi:3,4-dihydroxy-2-butanone-4-phosphate synthase [Metabacillus schmidteae]|uniref:3,4-dihydroxy-2-butanone-4-phosphate synthase n=1 Tax=Metabacillus schmidteae TaxID=2730405 RepID=UPI00158EDEBC|nr:3,4-dihydroxy-2-butanone-4-phosphate synthase [Metabacillus schmidteae]